MNGHLCVAAIAAFLVAPNLAINCRKNWCLPKAHTLCKYPNPEPALACGSVLSMGFTVAEREKFIHYHNGWRKFSDACQVHRGYPGLQDAAYYMPPLSWDNELAEIAQRWANQCRVGHDECRDVDRFTVAQNYALMGPYGHQLPTPEGIFWKWFTEVDNLDKEQARKVTTYERVANYTQAFWASFGKIGCGKIVFQTNTWNMFIFMVCNYGPAGNQFGNPLYKVIRRI